MQEEREAIFGCTDNVHEAQNYNQALSHEINMGGSFAQMIEKESTEIAAVDEEGTLDERLTDMKEERDSLFGFTQEDKAGWTNAGNHKHSLDFLKAIEDARSEMDASDKGMNISTVKEVFNVSNDIESPTGLSHLSADGESVHMVDIGAKKVSQREAVAQSKVVFPPEVLDAFKIDTNKENNEMVGPKGPIFATARLAGIMAAKKTSDLIPLCHPLPLDQVNIDISLVDSESTAVIRCKCRTTHKTGVEMEALVGASIAALTIYDMTKAISHQIRIEQTALVSKAGGKRMVGHQ